MGGGCAPEGDGGGRGRKGKGGAGKAGRSGERGTGAAWLKDRANGEAERGQMGRAVERCGGTGKAHEKAARGARGRMGGESEAGASRGGGGAGRGARRGQSGRGAGGEATQGGGRARGACAQKTAGADAPAEFFYWYVIILRSSFCASGCRMRQRSRLRSEPVS